MPNESLVEQVARKWDDYFWCGLPSCIKPSCTEARANLRAALGELDSRRAEQDESIPFCDSPCGHSSQYAYTTDGGKRIVCLVCVEHESVDRLREQQWISPIPIVVYCPRCVYMHIDELEWATKPHKTHRCTNCHYEWRPFEVPTVGVYSGDLADKLHKWLAVAAPPRKEGE